jgi:AcrR family transcriptional regulator
LAQTKKLEVRDAILKSAYRLFRRKGYMATTTAQIATGAKVSESNLYVYFGSKFAILFELYERWLRERIAGLETRLSGIDEPRERVSLILTMLWRELPTGDNGFTNNLMQALTTVARREGYRPDLLRWAESRIEALLLAALPPERAAKLAQGGLVHVLIMAQDGFAMNFHLNPGTSCDQAAIDLVCDLILG